MTYSQLLNLCEKVTKDLNKIEKEDVWIQDEIIISQREQIAWKYIKLAVLRWAKLNNFEIFDCCDRVEEVLKHYRSKLKSIKDDKIFYFGGNFYR